MNHGGQNPAPHPLFVLPVSLTLWPLGIQKVLFLKGEYFLHSYSKIPLSYGSYLVTSESCAKESAGKKRSTTMTLVGGHDGNR